MITTFQSAAQGNLASSSFPPTYLVARSSNAADTRTLTVSGLDDASVAQAETITLSGQKEQLSSLDFTKINSVSALTSGYAAYLYKAGTAASGLCYLTGQPSAGNTVTLGLTGNLQTYTFRARAQSVFYCQDAGDLSQGEYFDITFGGSTKRFWYDIDNAGTGAPANPGGGLYEIDIATGNTSTQVALATNTVVNAVADIFSSYVSDLITVTLEKFGTLEIVDGGGGAILYPAVATAGVTGAANDVLIGATVNDTATNLKKAINDEGTEGVHYGAGTTANAFLTASIDGSILTLTDKVPCARVLGWANSSVGTNINVSNLTGGKDGDLVASMTASQAVIYGAISLDDETLTSGNFPGLLDWTSDSVPVNGKRFSIHLAANDVNEPLECSYEYSTQQTPTIWRAGLSFIDDLDSDTPQVITPTEVVQHIRLKLLNENSAAASVNAKVCYE